MFDNTLHFLANDLESPNWRRGEHLPVVWIVQTVQCTEASSISERQLPAAQACQRLSSTPFKWLFDHYARHWPDQGRHASFFKGLQLLAMDSATLRSMTR